MSGDWLIECVVLVALMALNADDVEARLELNVAMPDPRFFPLVCSEYADEL